MVSLTSALGDRRSAVIRRLGLFVFRTPLDNRGSTLIDEESGGREVDCLMIGGALFGGMAMPGIMIFEGSSPWMRAATPALVPFRIGEFVGSGRVVLRCSDDDVGGGEAPFDD
jgi:hypothetical protein